VAFSVDKPGVIITTLAHNHTSFSNECHLACFTSVTRWECALVTNSNARSAILVLPDGYMPRIDAHLAGGGGVARAVQEVGAVLAALALSRGCVAKPVLAVLVRCTFRNGGGRGSSGRGSTGVTKDWACLSDEPSGLIIKTRRCLVNVAKVWVFVALACHWAYAAECRAPCHQRFSCSW